jgi:hypothetical protein
MSVSYELADSQIRFHLGVLEHFKRQGKNIIAKKGIYYDIAMSGCNWKINFKLQNHIK